jgi:hypothetical protein
MSDEYCYCVLSPYPEKVFLCSPCLKKSTTNLSIYKEVEDMKAKVRILEERMEDLRKFWDDEKKKIYKEEK